MRCCFHVSHAGLLINTRGVTWQLELDESRAKAISSAVGTSIVEANNGNV